MLSRLFGLILLISALSACNRSSARDGESDTQGAGVLVEPGLKPRDSATLINMTKRLATVTTQAAASCVPVKQALEASLLSAIVNVGGLPRSQIKDVLLRLLSPNNAACGGASCARKIGIKQNEVDDFLDDLKKQVEKNTDLNEASQRKTKNILLDSLERSNGNSQPIKKRSYIISGRTMNEVARIAQKPSGGGLRTISIEREVSWKNGSEVKKETYKGYVSFGFRGDILEVHTLDSMPEGKGTGSVLMKELAEEAKRLGKTEIHTLSTAHSAHDFYHKIGFRPEKGELSQMAKGNPDLYQSILNSARATPGFANKSQKEKEAIVDKALGRLTATWEASTRTVLDNTRSIQYD